MDTRPDILYYTLFPWDMPYSSVSLSLTRALSRTSRVFYINPPYTYRGLLHLFGEKRTRQRLSAMVPGGIRYGSIPDLPGVVEVQLPLVPPINWLPEGRAYQSLYRQSSQVVLRAIQQVIRDHSLRNFIYLNCYNPYYAGVLPSEMGALLNVYQCIDDMEEEPYTARHGARLEREVIPNADIVLSTSRGLLRRCLALKANARPLFNAANTALFEQARSEALPRPRELKELKGQIVGFVGNMDSHRIHYPLLRQVAESNPQRHLVLVGPVNSDGPSRAGLDRLPNVHLVGSRPLVELPAWLRHFDTVLIPFAKNKLTASIYPLKVNEYLAAGKPVVSTDFSEDIAAFSSHLYLARDEAEFCRLIDRAISEDSETKKDERQAVARQNTWEVRARQFWDIVEQQLRTVQV